MELAVAAPIHLRVNDLAASVPQFDHAFGAAHGGGRKVGFIHPGVLAIIKLSIDKGVAEIPHVRVGGNRLSRFLLRLDFPLLNPAVYLS